MYVLAGIAVMDGWWRVRGCTQECELVCMILLFFAAFHVPSTIKFLIAFIWYISVDVLLRALEGRVNEVTGITRAHGCSYLGNNSIHF